MTREEKKLYIIEHATENFQRDRSGRGYICPICGSGSGNKGTGITTRDGKHFTCWAGCFRNADIFDIIGLENGIAEDDFNGKLEAACNVFGIAIDNTNASRSTNKFTFTGKKDKDATERKPAPAEHQRTEQDYTDFLLQEHKRINDTEYHRGLSEETLNRFGVGFAARWTHPAHPNATPSPRLIIPTSKHSYVARYAADEVPDGQIRYIKVGATELFNAECLQESEKPVWIVEGEIDAMSVIEAGGEAVGLGSTSNADKFLRYLEAHRIKPKMPLIIALDNESGKVQQSSAEEATQKLQTGLQRLNISFYRSNPYMTYKDANEALNADRAAFGAAIAAEETRATEQADEEHNAEKEEYLKTSAAHYLQGFIDGIAESVNTPAIPTGFSKLDKLLDGGLYEGLYIIGAISSLGKSTLILQIADQIAQTGQDVLIFALEMSRNELISKSLSRLTIIGAENLDGYSTVNAKTARDITSGANYETYSQKEIDLIKLAITEYSLFSEHVYITEGIGNIGTDEVRKGVEKHTRLTGKAPVVIIDYLQILAPADPRLTDKQATDRAVMELKRVSRDFKTPVIGISSLNRKNYNVEISMEAFKESGAIEYSSDVLIGLQFEGAGKDGFDLGAAKKRTPRQIELCILKNRNGETEHKVNFKYYQHYNYFKED